MSTADQLVHAASVGDAETLRQLLQAGGNASALTASGEAIIHLSIRARSAGCVRLLVSPGCDVEAFDTFGNSALIAAAQLGDFAIMELLLEAGADVCRSNDAGLAAMQMASTRNEPELLVALLCALANCPDKAVAADEVMAALYTAAALGSAGCVGQLLQFPPAANAIGCMQPLSRAAVLRRSSQLCSKIGSAPYLTLSIWTRRASSGRSASFSKQVRSWPGSACVGRSQAPPLARLGLVIQPMLLLLIL
jgi:hypothetical protein